MSKRDAYRSNHGIIEATLSRSSPIRTTVRRLPVEERRPWETFQTATVGGAINYVPSIKALTNIPDSLNPELAGNGAETHRGAQPFADAIDSILSSKYFADLQANQPQRKPPIKPHRPPTPNFDVFMSVNKRIGYRVPQPRTEKTPYGTYGAWETPDTEYKAHYNMKAKTRSDVLLSKQMARLKKMQSGRDPDCPSTPTTNDEEEQAVIMRTPAPPQKPPAKPSALTRRAHAIALDRMKKHSSQPIPFGNSTIDPLGNDSETPDDRSVVSDATTSSLSARPVYRSAAISKRHVELLPPLL